MHLRALLPLSPLVLSAMMVPALGEETSQESIEAILAVADEGAGNLRAAAGWKRLAEGDAESLVPLLAAMDGANELAVNWLASAVQVVAARAQAENRLPLTALGNFLLTPQNAPRARLLAFELIESVEPETAAQLTPGMLHDSSNPLRRLAVAELLDRGDKLAQAGNVSTSTLLYRQALGAARDIDQIEKAAKALRERGVSVDLPALFGFLQYWQIIGPFDNSERKGFDTAFPPEVELNLAAEYDGKNGKIHWVAHSTADDYGMLDFNEPLGALKDVTAYAYTEFEADAAQPAELRLGCKNAWKIWLNGDFVFGRDEYHRGMRIDQYRLPVQLRSGTNTILVKVCQNEEIEDWTVEWQFQLRVCDGAGAALLSTDRLPSPPKPGLGRKKESA